MGPIFRQLSALQDECKRTDDAARKNTPGSMSDLEANMAAERYLAFLRETAIDFEIMARAATERPASMDWLVNKVAAALVDNLNFDAVASQANFANKAVMEARHEAEDLRREVAELRKMVDRLAMLDEQRAKRAVA